MIGIKQPSDLRRFILTDAVLLNVAPRKENVNAGIEVGRAYGEVEGYHPRPFGCEVGSHFHHRIDPFSFWHHLSWQAPARDSPSSRLDDRDGGRGQRGASRGTLV
jgi:hypothetical protein